MRRKPLSSKPMDEARLLRDLETILAGAMESKAWAPAIRAVELLGKHIGLWKSEDKPRSSLADMINEAAVTGSDGTPSA